MTTEELKQFRKLAGLTQKGLADRIGMSEAAIRGWESGRSDIPKMAEIALSTIVVETCPTCGQQVTR